MDTVSTVSWVPCLYMRNGTYVQLAYLRVVSSTGRESPCCSMLPRCMHFASAIISSLGPYLLRKPAFHVELLSKPVLTSVLYPSLKRIEYTSSRGYSRSVSFNKLSISLAILRHIPDMTSHVFVMYSNSLVVTLSSSTISLTM